MKKLLLSAVGLIITMNGAAVMAARTSHPLALKPPMGWNSFGSYRVEIHEQACLQNLKTRIYNKYYPTNVRFYS